MGRKQADRKGSGPCTTDCDSEVNFEMANFWDDACRIINELKKLEKLAAIINKVVLLLAFATLVQDTNLLCC